jgi:hypothetical protein
MVKAHEAKAIGRLRRKAADRAAVEESTSCEDPCMEECQGPCGA